MTTDAELIVPEGVGTPTSIPADVFAAATAAYVAEQRIDMRALANELGIGRATLYRRAGNREELIDELIWWRSRNALADAANASADRRGVPRLVAMIDQLLRRIENDRPLHAFLENDPEVALRILTGAHSLVQQGMSKSLERLIELEVTRGHFVADLDASTLAYAIVRISEGFLYADIIADRSPDIDRASTVIEALMRGLDTSTRFASAP
ncbi:MAG: QsdR family transcriptional regulator [Actinomycetota bacterium]|nr:QsdR family transcriptional regulator [Actinomycetota bacterium]